MAKYLPLPDGNSLKVPDEMGYEDAISLARQRFPALFPDETKAQKSGIAGAFGRGAESLLSSYQTAAGALTDPDAAAKQALERQELLSKKYAEPTSLERVKKAYADQGLFSAAKEVASQIPGAIAEQVPQMGAVLGGARLGSMAGSLAGPVGTVVGGVAGAGLSMLPQFFGSNIQRQAAEQTERGEPISIDRTAAAAAAVPQAAVEGAGYALSLGGRLVSKLTGIPEKALTLGKGNAQKLAEERLLTTLAKGTAVGAAAEIPTEIAQQMLERAQAGLSVTDADALSEYGQTAYQVGLLAPIGAAGRLSQRGGARQQVEADKQEAAKKAVEAEEAARTQPDALNQLYDQYQALSQQKARVDAQVDEMRPKKGSTAADKQAFQNAKTKRDEFLKTEFQPVEQEYNKRKSAIDEMFGQRQAALEAETAPTQPTAKQIVPSDLPGAEPFQLAPVPRLMGTYGDLRTQLNDVQTQLAAGPDTDAHMALETQRQLLASQMAELAPIIEQRGGTTDTQEELNKKSKALEAERIKLLAQGDFEAAAKQIEKLKALQLKLPMLEEALLTRTQAGQTKELFGGATPVKSPEDTAQEQEQLAIEGERGLYGPEAKAESAKQAFANTTVGPRGQLEAVPDTPEPKAEENIQPAQLQAVETAKAKVGQAEQQITQLTQTKGAKTPELYQALDALNQSSNELSRAQEDVGRPALKPAVLDIFDPYNIMQEALRRGDTKLINDLARQTNKNTLRQSLDEKAAERDRLLSALEGRLDSAGIKRERADLFSQIYDQEAQTKFKNGTYPNKPLQELYDKGGVAAVEYEWVLDKVKPLMAKVTTPQGNAKKSLYQQLVETAAEHTRLTEQMESGVAVPTMGEKVAGVQAKLGKGEAPAARLMDAAERYQLQRKIDGLLSKYKMLEGKVAPIRDHVLAVQNSLYETKPLAKPSVVKEAKRAAAEAEGRAEKTMSRAAATASRINKGNVRKEAEASQQMRDLAIELGERTPAYTKFEKDRTKRILALEQRYGDEDLQLQAYRRQVAKELPEKAAELGKQTPEYKATLKEQVAYFKEVLPTAGKQEIASKRTGQATRKQTAAPKTLRVAGSGMSEKEQERIIRESEEPKLAPAYTEEGSAIERREIIPTEDVQARDTRVERVFNVKADYTSPYHGKTYAEAAELAAENAKDPLIKELFQALAKSLAAHPVDAMRGRVFITSKAGFNEEAGWTRITGLYDPAMQFVLSPNEAVSADAEMVLLHELSHAATLEGLNTNKELNATVTSLRQRVSSWLATPEGSAYYDANKDAISKGAGEDAAAYGLTDNAEFLAEVFSNNSFQELLKQIPSDTPRRSVWQKLVDTFVKFLALRTDGQRSLLEDALEAADHAMAATRKAERSTSSAAFKKWFGRSRVEDENGQPLVVYHGTDAAFDEFKYGVKSGSGAMHGKGFYFGNAGQASAYADIEGGRVIPVYLRMENPFFGSSLPQTDINRLLRRMPEFETVYKKWQDENAEYPGVKPSIERLGVLSGDRNNFIQKALTTAGYDGRIVTFDREAFWADPDTEYVVFDSAQIKSALSNSGAYDRKIPSIVGSSENVGVVEEKPGVFGFKRQRTQSSSVVAREPSVVDKLLGNVMGLAGRVQLVDQYAALSEAIKKGMNAGVIDSLEATNAEYLLRFGQQRSQFAGQFLTSGPVKLRLTKKGDFTESVFESAKGVSMVDVASALNAAKLATPIEQENMFTVYLAGQRAKQVGWDKLNFENPGKAKAEYDGVMAQLAANKPAADAFKNAAKLYQQYNAGLMDWLVQTGVMTPKKAAELKAITYVPYYRVNKNGEVQLMVDKETPVRISNIKDEPQLQQLVGGNDFIMPLFTSAAQNTFMITNMGLRNQTVKETGFLLQKLGIASRVAPGAGPTGPDVVRFKKNGEDYHVVIDTDLYGIPADLIVKGMEGIKTTIPAVVRLMGYPADILRRFVTRMPAYAVRQIIRDPLNAWLTTGTDAVPVLSSMKELASMVAGRSEAERKLMATGAISSNVFSGDEQDIAKYLKDISAGKSMWAKTLAKLDAFALQGDAATRAVIYKDSLDKNMSEQESLLRTLESMNFSRRGLSPSMQMLSVLIPFFNAQIQGLDVVYRAFEGNMPYSEQLKIREKLLARGTLMALGTIAYAALMRDDEAYKRAKPEERFANWFVYVPGVDEPVRVPMPFELGFLFKALPEAIYGLAANDDKASKTLKGLGTLLNQSNPFALPQAVKPLTEVVLGKSFYSGDIESAREKAVLATDRYRDNTTEVSKLLGQVTGKVSDISPISIDYLIRGYFGGLGIAITQLANPILASDQKSMAEPSTKPSKLPLIGGLFQPVEGRGTLDEAYDRMQEIRQVKGTYNKLVEDGKRAEALEFAQSYTNDLAQTSVSGRVQKQLGELAKQERVIKANPTMTTEEKDRRLEQLDKIKVQIARQFLALPR